MEPASGEPLTHLVAVMRQLRAECAWKQEQTHRSLVRYLLEEAHEVVDAIESAGPGRWGDLSEELGDLLLQVYFHAAIAEEAGEFTLDDVASGLIEKLLRRNPHVFGDGDPALSAVAVNEVWESVKAAEKQRASLTEGIAPTLPALLRADKVLDRRERAGAPASAATTLHLLIPSPLLGPATWEPVARALRASGVETEVVDLGDGPREPERIIAAVTAASNGRPVVLIPHSNAGLFLPPLTALLEVRAVVFVDAALPAITGETPLAPPELLERLRTLADQDGLLPPWTRWWEESEVAALFPDGATRRRVEREEPRIDLAYFEGVLPVAPRWADIPVAYLAFGATYAAEQQQARDRGWPLHLSEGGHLHMLIDPTGVARQISGLLETIQGPGTALGDRLLQSVVQARALGLDPEQELRDSVRRLLERDDESF